jgi:hypothetical protein
MLPAAMVLILVSGFGSAAAGARSHDVDLRVTGSARPHHAYFDGAPVRIRYRVHGRGASKRRVHVRIRIVLRSSGRVVRTFLERRVMSGSTHHQLWVGRTSSGHPVPDGHYDVFAGRRRSGRLHVIGGFVLHGHIFPVRGPHGTRGAIGEFGAPRSGGRTHEGFDVVAACRTRLVAARGGRVLQAGYDPVLYGNYILIHGQAEQHSYFYAHLRSPALARRGDLVRTGQRIGRVGETGNARTVGCHLHFELHRHGVPYNPEPALARWDRYS